MTNEKAADKRKALMDTLASEVEALRTSGGWQRWMNAASRFRRYSINNQILIATQRPNATHVGGFNYWRDMGRHVRKGEKGIAIVAPRPYKVSNDADSADSTKRAKGAEAATSGDAPKSAEDDERIRLGFRVVYVFDITQTDGLDAEGNLVPGVPSSFPVLDQPGCDTLFDRLALVVGSLGLELVMARAERGSARGWYEANLKRITVVDSLPAADRCATIIHELGHALDPRCNGGKPATRPERELVAESVAFIVGSGLGLPMTEASTQYLTGWGADAANLAALAGDVVDIAGQIDQQIMSISLDLMALS